jgi:ADP-heptose:LPS heptosyltransferase
MRRLLQLIRAETDLAILLPSTPANINRSLTLCDEFKNVFVYQSQTSVSETAAMVRGARFVVSPDTAVVHIASAFNKPTLGFYLDDSPPWLPLASRQKVLLFKKTVNEEFDSAEITNFVRENC